MKSPLRSLRDVIVDFKPDADKKDIDDACSFVQACFDANGATSGQLRSHAFFNRPVAQN